MSLHASLRRWSYKLLRGTCILCGEHTNRITDLCKACQRSLPWIEHHCRYCGEPLSGESDICMACIQNRPSFSSSFVPLVYQYPIDGLIQQYKNHARLSYGCVLGELMVDYLAPHQTRLSDTIVVPVALHPSKFRQRGFNQAMMLAETVAESLGNTVVNALIRTRATNEQKRLDQKQRRRNMRGAFIARPLNGERILLVDDVVTTGATVEAATQALIGAGASEVIITAVAKTPVPS